MLDPTSCAADYSTFHDYTKQKVRDLWIFVKSHDSSFFIDLLAIKSHDHNFTSSAWTEATKIFEEKTFALGTKIKRLRLWSDGGLKVEPLAMENNVTVSGNYFGPYHEHSEVLKPFVHFS